MKKLCLYSLSLRIILCLFSFTSAASTPCQKTEKLLYLIQKLHYQAPVFNDDFSDKVLEEYFYNLDDAYVIFYSSDIQKIKEIKADPLNRFCKAYSELNSILIKRLKQSDSLLNKLSGNKTIWDKKEKYISTGRFHDLYPKNLKDKSAHFEKLIKFYMLDELDADDSLALQNFEKDNAAIRSIAVKRLRKKLDRLISSEEERGYFLETALLQAITRVCDPHSDYFTPERKKDFDESLSSSVEIFGFSTLENEDQEIEISSVKPGSSAWKSNQIHEGDVLLAIRFKNKSKIDLSSYSVEDLHRLLSTNPEKEIYLTVRKVNGNIVKVYLKKTVQRSEENVINSFVLRSEINVGYISLPSFYNSRNNISGSSCANDVAKEILKLRSENINGLILDLRDNGGGSLREALDLAGIFIDYGPMCFEKSRDKKPLLLKDQNRGLIYTGALVILINKTSASASEIFAQIMKNHNRAMIVGSPSYGKASGQIVLPLDTSYSMDKYNIKYDLSDGHVKLTIEKFFDLSGNTHQLSGVHPDIFLPDFFYKIPVAEKNSRYALSNEILDKKAEFIPLLIQGKADIISKSLFRVNASGQFKSAQNFADTIYTEYEKLDTLFLYPEFYISRVHRYRNLLEQYNSLLKEEDPNALLVLPNKDLADLMLLDEFIKNNTESQASQIKIDIIVNEAFKIIKDYQK